MIQAVVGPNGSTFGPVGEPAKNSAGRHLRVVRAESEKFGKTKAPEPGARSVIQRSLRNHQQVADQS